MLEPLYELLHLLHEDGPAAGGVAVLVPLEDDLLGEHVRLVQQQHDLVEGLKEVHVVVAVLLDLVQERELGAGGAGEGGEQGHVLLQVAEGLRGKQESN